MRRFRKSKFYNAHALNAIIGSGATDVGVETVGVTQGELPTNLGVQGNIMTAGEFLVGLTRVPNDLDPKHPVYFRVVFSSTNTGSAGITWIALVKFTKNEVALVAPGSLSALDTVIGEKNTSASKAAVATGWGKLNNTGIQRTDVEDGAMLQVRLESDVIDAGHSALHFVGLEMSYTPIEFEGPGVDLEAPERSAVK
jgi:hypothetical protein